MGTSQQNFEKNLLTDKEAEIWTQEIFNNLGFYVFPKYLYSDSGAPCLVGLNDNIVVPDLDVSGYGQRFWVEVKNKPLRKLYPDTGFSERLCNEYLKVQEITNSNIFIICFDWKLGKVYGNWLNELLKPRTIIWKNEKILYPHIIKANTRGNTIFFPYPEAFITIGSMLLQPYRYELNKYDYDALKILFKINK